MFLSIFYTLCNTTNQLNINISILLFFCVFVRQIILIYKFTCDAAFKNVYLGSD